MSRHAIILHDREFKTKSEAIAFFRQMLSKYELGQSVDTDDKLLLTALVGRHRYATDLLAHPITTFRVVKEEMFGNRRFEIVRDDGSVNSFAYLKCINQPADQHFMDVMWAMRCEVIEQTRQFHNDAFRGHPAVVCGITGEPIKRKGSHVDHAPPRTFQVLVADFVKLIGVKLKGIEITSEGRLGITSAKYFADRELAARWQNYHRQHAVLRITSEKANLQQKKIKVDFSEIR
jgi:hypothetical protein